MKRLLIPAALLLSIGCSSSDKQSITSGAAEPGVNSNFTVSMRELQGAMNDLLPMVVDSKEFNKIENQPKIEEKIKKLVVLSQNVVHNPATDSKDPSVQFISRAFSEDLSRSYESLKLGKRDFARYNLMNVTAYCIECHTRTSTGPSFQSDQLQAVLKNITGLEKGEFLLSTRQYDAAFAEFGKYIDAHISSPNANIFDLEKAVRYSLAISIKYQKDANKSMALVKKIKAANGVPFYLKQNAIGWEASISEWQKEKPPVSTTQGLLKASRQWVRKGQDLQSDSPDRGGDIYFLRALSDLHLVLSSKLNSDELGEALFMTGLSYEAVRDLSVWTLHENYYEACIRKVPHSTWSEKCYRRLEQSIYFGFSGSSGLQVPVDMLRKLDDLKFLALRPNTKQ